MKIGFNPQVATQARITRGPQTQATPPAPGGSDGGVTISLSPAAQQILKTGDATYTGKAPAHQARQFIANSLAAASAEDGDAPDISGPFGQIVKTFAPGHNKEIEVVEEPGEVPEDGGDTAATDGTGGTGTTEGGDTTVADGSDGGGDTGGTGTTEGGDTTVADGSDGSGDTGGSTNPAEGDGTTVVATPEEGGGTGLGDTDPMIVAEEPDITDIRDGSEPTNGETTEPESGMAGSGDAVASTGDGESNDGGTIGDATAPVAVVDAGDVTDELLELLELLDENGEEVV
jgi:hypothetical protein